MTAATSRRLPGLRFEARPPPVAEPLPRMDVAAFVGFAASGPLHRPVVVEDPARFHDLFGRDAPLAWDTVNGEVAQAHLPPAVRAFFRNGGVRCVVVRVAGAARANRFPVSGLLRCQGTALAPAFARARSEGSWSDALQVGATVASRPLLLDGWSGEAGKVDGLLAHLGPGDALSPGELLRVAFPGGLLLVTPVSGVRSAGDGPGGLRSIRIPLDPTSALWFRSEPSVAAPSSVRWFLPGGTVDLTVLAGAAAGGDTLRLDLAAGLDQAPLPGSVLRLDGAGETWFKVELLQSAPGGEAAVQVTGPVLERLPAPPMLPSTGGAIAEVLELELWERQGNGTPRHLPGLGFCQGHPRDWATLPADSELFDDQGNAVPARPELPQTLLAEEVAFPRFSLAGEARAVVDGREPFDFPVGAAFLDPGWLGCGASPEDALVRDGLEAFGSELFLDRRLQQLGTEVLLAEAEFVRDQSPAFRPLTGVHALLGCDEVTLVAVPDAIHPGWEPAPAPPRPPPPVPPVPVAPPAGFGDCGAAVLPTPALILARPPDATGSFTLGWAPIPNATVLVEEATRPGFEDAAALASGSDGSLDVRGRSPGVYYYRALATAAGLRGGWSSGLLVEVPPPSEWRLSPPSPSPSGALLDVQRALLRLCAARGDLLAVLSLPEGTREDAALAHVARLRAPPGGERGVQPLGYDEQRDLSHGALYHPWLVGAEDEDPARLRREPPDGAACGVMARRALDRGAWVAPANEPLADVSDLTPKVEADRWLDLQEAQVNLVRQEPRGFLALAANTLAVDADLIPIPVRRLLALLRRAALRLGPSYVFEPNDDSLRRLVERGFEDLLGQLHARGAFAGATAASSYRVVAGIDAARDAAERGLFFVDLKVAPSLPLRFLTVRLVQSGDRGFATEVR